MKTPFCRFCRCALCPVVALLVVQAPAPARARRAPPAAPQFKGKAPVSNEVLKIKLPRAQEAQLSNGAHLMVLEDHRVPSVQFEIIMIGAGGYYDPPDLPGLADTTASLMDEGTTTKIVGADRAGARHDGGERVGDRRTRDRRSRRSPARR